MLRHTPSSSSSSSTRAAATAIISHQQQQQQHCLYSSSISIKFASQHLQNHFLPPPQQQQQCPEQQQRDLHVYNIRTRHGRNHHFQQQVKQRQCCLSSSSIFGKKCFSFSTKPFTAPPRITTATDDKNEKEKLNPSTKSPLSLLTSRTNHLLHKIPTGQMSTRDVSELRTIQVEWSKSPTFKAAIMTEEILNKLVLEREHCLLQLRDENENENNEKKKMIIMVGSTPYKIAMHAWSKCKDVNDAPEKAMEILEQLKNQYQKERALLQNIDYENDDSILSTTARPDTICYNNVLHAWSNSNREDAVSKAEELLSEMESSSSNETEEFLEIPTPDRTSYNTIMNTYANQTSNQYGYAKKAEDILFKMSKLSSQDSSPSSSNHDMHPDTNSFNIVLKAWSNSIEENSIERAYEILELMMKLSTQGMVTPNGISFGTVLKSFGKMEDKQAAIQKMEELLTMFEETCHGEEKKEVEGATSCYNAALSLVAKSGLQNTGSKAEEILARMKDVGGVIPDVISLTTVMEAWSKQNTVKGAEHAEEVLHQMMMGSSGKGMKPNDITFNVAMNAWVKSSLNNDAIASRVEHLYHIMNKYNCKPNTATCSILMQAYSNSSKDMSLKAYDLLQTMERDYRQHGDAHTKPNGYAYNAVISMLAKSNHPKKGKLAYDTIMRMLRYEDTAIFVDTITFNVAIAAQGGDSGNTNAAAAAAKRAMNLFEVMEKIHRDNPNATRIQPDTISFTSLMNVLQKSSDVKSSTNAVMKLLRTMEALEKNGSEVVRLDVIAFRVALRVLSKFGDAKRAREVFDWMERLYKSGREELRPDEACCNSLIWAQACSNEDSKKVLSSKKKGWKRQLHQGEALAATKSFAAAAERAQELLVNMIQRFRQGETDILPGKGGFNTVVRAWVTVGDAKSIKKAELILKLMEDLYESGTINFSADSATYTIIITALVKSTVEGATERAIELFNQMESKGLLDTIAFNTTISALAKSTDPNKAEKAQRLLQKMIERQDARHSTVKADIVSYNTVLNACAFTRGSAEDRKKALFIANETYRQLQESSDLTPGQITYATMMKAYTNLADEKVNKIDLIKPIFVDCAERGLVGSMITKEIRYALSDAQQKSLLEGVSGQDNVDIKTIPSRWRQNLGRKS